jgi:hypothetical protein
MSQEIPRDGIMDAYPGLVAYLEKTKDERKQYNRSKYNKDIRKAARWAIKFLVLFSQRQEEAEVRKVLDTGSVGELVESLTGEGCQAIEPRHYEISKAVLWAGSRRLRECVDEVSAIIANRQIDETLRYLRMLPEPKEGHENKEYEVERRATRKRLESKGYY